MTTTTSVQLPTGTWAIDPVHSSAAFRVKHFGVSTFRSSFADLSGTYVGHDEHAHLSGAVTVDSIAVTQPDLRGHLLSPDFFDVGNHPSITFEASKLTLGENGVLSVEGDLTINGVTKTLVATGTATEPGADFRGIEHFGINLETTIDRTAYGVTWQAELPGGKVAVENDVTLEVSLEFTPAEA